MLKRYLFAGTILIVSLLAYAESYHLTLTFYIFSPIALFVFFYAANNLQNLVARIFLGIVASALLLFIILHLSLESVLLGIIQVCFFLGLILYRMHWNAIFLQEALQRENAEKELEAFQRKYTSRLSSLQHLEKQVTGLLDLFEATRDFSEYLTFQGITEILSKRVKPMFPFRKMNLLMAQPKNGSFEPIEHYQINEEGFQPLEDPLSEDDCTVLQKTAQTKTVFQTEKFWIFPLLTDDHVVSYLKVEGAHADDLAKFEVLSAFLSLQIAKIRLYQSVRELAIRDSLTDVFVRRHFLERFEEELKRSIRHKLPLAVLMLDIDHFKRYNDDYGHLAGDVTLKQTAAILQESLRKLDIVARYGGEEFAVVLPESIQEAALEVAERIRSSVARNVYKLYNTETRVTVSIGVTVFSPSQSANESEPDYSQMTFELLQQADKALYQAKEEGRNQVVLYKLPQ